jgi:hypothetical protein
MLKTLRKIKALYQLFKGYQPPTGEHNSLPVGSPTSWTWGRATMSEMPDGTAGHVLTAQGAGVDPAYAIGTKIIRKTADEIVNNSAILQDDDHLFFAMGANEVWQADVFIFSNSSATADLSVALSLPTGAVAQVLWNGYDTASNPTYQTINDGTTVGLGGLGSDALAIVMRCLVINGANAGNFQLQWAQLTAEVSDTIVKANSCIIAHKLA